ncbi:MAG: glycosyltransferase family 4 protein [Hyphomicrobiaceae bacterium]
MTTHWAILTGEYPPQPGGVSDYTHLVARGLADAGDRVRVYAPGRSAARAQDGAVAVHRLPGHFGPGALAALDALLREAPRPDRILVQYVPQAFGWKGMNLPFAAWLALRATRIAPVRVMFHEVATPFAWRPARHAFLGAITRAMARLTAGAADRVLVSTPAWGTMLKRICPCVKDPEWAPVPSNIGVAPGRAATPLTDRFPLLRGKQLVGHFGTYGPLIAHRLEPTLLSLLDTRPECAAVLFGDGSDAFRAGLLARHPAYVGRLIATGRLDAGELAQSIAQCDLTLQPYPDGVSTRRGSAIAVLALGVPMVTNAAAATEPIWTTGCVAIADDATPAGIAAKARELLLASGTERAELGRCGLQLYREMFAIEHTISKLRGEHPPARCGLATGRASP